MDEGVDGNPKWVPGYGGISFFVGDISLFPSDPTDFSANSVNDIEWRKLLPRLKLFDIMVETDLWLSVYLHNEKERAQKSETMEFLFV